jgi:dienelactone hydrolase
MPRSLSLVSLAGFVGFLLASLWLARLERGGAPHADLELAGEVPATLYLPGAESDATAFAQAPPPDARPPAIVLSHGIAMDRVAMSSLARRLAGAGYAVLALDLRGHGENRNAFERGSGRPDVFAPDLAAAVDFLRTLPQVDGSRIALMGHSMGAGASLDFATRDTGLDAVVLISGGWSVLGPHRAPNALFIYAAGDPQRLKQRTYALAARISGVAQPVLGETYGDFRQGTALRLVEVPGVDHATILWSEAAGGEIASWLDAAFERMPGAGRLGADPRGRAVALLGGLLLLVLPGLGRLVGGLTPTTEHLPPTRRAAGLALLAGALAVTLPLVSLGNPGAILSIEIGDAVVIHFALAGILLLVLVHLRDRAQFASLFANPQRSLLGAAIAMVAVYTLLQPFGSYLHRLTLTPERLAVFGLVTAGLLPFDLALQALLRRGPPLSAALYAAAGRLLVVLSLFAGVWLGALPPVVTLMLLPLLPFFLLVEMLAAGFYSASRNLLAIAAIDAAWLALIIAAIMPIRI